MILFNQRKTIIYIILFLLKNKQLYFIDYAITVVPISPLCPLHPVSTLPQAIPPLLFTSMGHAYKFFGYSISYTVLYIPMASLYLPNCTS